jgi:hypothetical protein
LAKPTELGKCERHPARPVFLFASGSFSTLP